MSKRHAGARASQSNTQVLQHQRVLAQRRARDDGLVVNQHHANPTLSIFMCSAAGPQNVKYCRCCICGGSDFSLIDARKAPSAWSPIYRPLSPLLSGASLHTPGQTLQAASVFIESVILMPCKVVSVGQYSHVFDSSHEDAV